MRAVVLAWLVTAMVTARPAHAQDHPGPEPMTEEVKAHWERGLAEHAARHYPAASAEFEACYRLAGRRECLFAWAQAARLAGDCDTASALYRRYLEAALSARQAEAARTQLAACEAVVVGRAGAIATPVGDVRTPDAAPGREVAPPPPAPAPAVPDEARAREPWYRDVLGDVLAGAGIAGLAAGTLVYLSAVRDASSGAPTYERARTTAIVAAAAGASLVAAGVLHMVLRDDARATPRTRIGISLDGAQLAIHCARAF
jgi:hypothetical protein